MVGKLGVVIAAGIGLVVVITAMFLSCLIIQNIPEPNNPEWAENQKRILSFACTFNPAGFIVGPSAVGAADVSCSTHSGTVTSPL